MARKGGGTKKCSKFSYGFKYGKITIFSWKGQSFGQDIVDFF